MFVIKNRTGIVGKSPFFVSKDSTIKETLLDSELYSTLDLPQAKKFVTSRRAYQWLKITECNKAAFQVVSIECANAHIRMAA